MITAILLIGLAFYWLLRETDYLRVRLPVGEAKRIELERIEWSTCQSRYGTLKLSCGVNEPLCTWEWLEQNTHPIPQVIVDFGSGGVRYHWNIKHCNILKNAITATHAKVKPLNGHLHYNRNAFGGLVAPLPTKVN